MSLLTQNLCFEVSHETDHDIHKIFIWNNLTEARKIRVSHILTTKAQHRSSWNHLCKAQQQGFFQCDIAQRQWKPDSLSFTVQKQWWYPVPSHPRTKNKPSLFHCRSSFVCLRVLKYRKGLCFLFLFFLTYPRPQFQVFTEVHEKGTYSKKNLPGILQIMRMQGMGLTLFSIWQEFQYNQFKNCQSRLHARE